MRGSLLWGPKKAPLRALKKADWGKADFLLSALTQPAFLEGARGNRSLEAKERFPRNIYLKFPRFQAGFRALFSEIYKEWKFSLGEAGI